MARKILPCGFGQVSLGEGVAALALKVDREHFADANQIDELLVGKRITGKVVLGSKDAPTQKRLIPDSQHVIEGTFDITSVRITKKHISIRVSFAIQDIAGQGIDKFPKRTGQLVIDRAAEIPDDHGTPTANEEDPEEE